MKFKIPFTSSEIEILRKKSKNYSKIFRKIKGGKLQNYLENSGIDLEVSEYLGICLRTFIFSFIILLIIFTSIFFFFKIKDFYLYSCLLSMLFSGFIFMKQHSYPKIYCLKKAREIEKNLISSLQDMLVQLESGVPIYDILVNISSSDYGEVSNEFKRIVKEMNSGIPQIQAIDNLINRTSSSYFKKVLWQLSNGLRSGSDMSIVIKDTIDNLNKEQAIQIQSYGAKLNPLIMFYMLIAVIIPSLGLSFLTIISSMVGLSGSLIKLLFLGIFVIIALLQIMFLGMIKSRRPSLL